MKQKCNLKCFKDSDPRSKNYSRILDMPKLNGFHIIYYFVITMLLLCGIYLFLYIGRYIIAVSVVLMLIIYIIFNLKGIVVITVKMYQRFAPKKIRMRCRFEPSCSQYMILAVEKYGAIHGLVKGIKRLCKCNSRDNGLNGGFDYP